MSCATSEKAPCCCACCRCEQLVIALSLGHHLRVRLGGPFSGDCFLQAGGTSNDICYAWSWGVYICDEDVQDHGAHLEQMMFYCLKKEKSLKRMVFAASLSNMGCNFTSEAGDPDPVGGQVAKYPTEIRCKKGELFYAKFVFPLHESQPGGCNFLGGAANPVIFEIEALQTYPPPEYP